MPRFPYGEKSLDLLVSILDNVDGNAVVDILETTSSYSEDEEECKKRIIERNHSLSSIYNKSSQLQELLQKYNHIVRQKKEFETGVPMSAEFEKIDSCVEKLASSSNTIEDTKELCELIDDYQLPKYNPQDYLEFLNNLETSLSKAGKYTGEIVKLISSYDEEEGFIITDIIKRKTEALKNKKIMAPLKRLIYTLKSDSISNTKKALNENDRLSYIKNIAEIAYELEERGAVDAISETAKSYNSKDLNIFMERMNAIARSTKKTSLVEKIAKDCEGREGKELKDYLTNLKYICDASQEETAEKVVNNYNKLGDKEKSNYLKQMSKISKNIKDKSVLKDIASLPEHDIRGNNLKKRLKEINKYAKKEETPYETKNLVDRIKKEDHIRSINPIIKYTKNPSLRDDIESFAETLGRSKRIKYLSCIGEVAENTYRNNLDTSKILGSLNNTLKELKRKNVNERKLIRIVKALNKFTNKNKHLAPSKINNAIYEGMISGLRHLSPDIFYDVDGWEFRGLDGFLKHYFSNCYKIGSNACAPVKSYDINKNAVEKVIEGAGKIPTISRYLKYLEKVGEISQDNIYNPEGLMALGEFSSNMLQNKSYGRFKRSLNKVARKVKKYCFFNLDQINRMVA